MRFVLPFLFTLLAALGAPRPVLLTTDCGADMDDQWALAQLALAPEIDLRGIVTTHAPDLANPASETSARIAKNVLAEMGVTRRIPIYAGSSTPLINRFTAQRNEGVDFIIKEAKQHDDGQLAVLVIGAATDVASALLVDPSLARRIEVISMGFEKWPAGDDPYNVKNDIAAWQALLESGVPLTVGDVAVTNRHLRMSRQRAREMLGTSGPAGRYLAAIQADFVGQHPDLATRYTGDRETWPVWDLVTVAHLLGMTQSEEHPRPGLRNDMRFLHTEFKQRGCRINQSIRWITSINEAALWDRFAENVRRSGRP